MRIRAGFKVDVAINSSNLLGWYGRLLTNLVASGHFESWKILNPFLASTIINSTKMFERYFVKNGTIDEESIIVCKYLHKEGVKYMHGASFLLMRINPLKGCSNKTAIVGEIIFYISGPVQ